MSLEPQMGQTSHHGVSRFSLSFAKGTLPARIGSDEAICFRLIQVDAFRNSFFSGSLDFLEPP